MKKVTITGKMWNEIVAMQDKLVLFYNGFGDKPLYLTWHLSPKIGMVSATLYDTDEDGRPNDRLDGFTYYADGRSDEYTFDHAIDKIIEWEKKYGFEKD